jgi:hypothetical protein
MRSTAQHILALAIRDILTNNDAENTQNENTDQIKCYAQDPAYTLIDELILHEAGFTVLDDPRAFLEVDEASIVIAISPDIPIKQIIADIARPAILIWDKITFLNRSTRW